MMDQASELTSKNEELRTTADWSMRAEGSMRKAAAESSEGEDEDEFEDEDDIRGSLIEVPLGTNALEYKVESRRASMSSDVVNVPDVPGVTFKSKAGRNPFDDSAADSDADADADSDAEGGAEGKGLKHMVATRAKPPPPASRGSLPRSKSPKQATPEKPEKVGKAPDLPLPTLNPQTPTQSP